MLSSIGQHRMMNENVSLELFCQTFSFYNKVWCLKKIHVSKCTLEILYLAKWNHNVNMLSPKACSSKGKTLALSFRIYRVPPCPSRPNFRRSPNLLQPQGQAICHIHHWVCIILMEDVIVALSCSLEWLNSMSPWDTIYFTYFPYYHIGLFNDRRWSI